MAKDPEALRQKILADPNTAKIAQTLSIPLEEYVAQVLEFAMNPGLEPELVVMKDEDAIALGGPKPPTQEEMNQYVAEAVKIGEAVDDTAYAEAQKAKVALPQEPAAQAKDGEVREDLAAEVLKIRKGGGNA